MILKRFAFLAVAGAFVLAGCDGTEQEDTAQAESVAASEAENPHAGTESAMGEMPGSHEGEISTAAGVENPHTSTAMSMPGEGGVTEIMFNCADDKAFLFALVEGLEQARITVDGETYELEKIPSASGMKFSDGTWGFFGKGPEAVVMKNDEMVLTDCKAAGHP